MKRTRIPPGGMGSGIERAYSKWLFFIIKYYNIIKLFFTFFLVICDPKAYNKLTTSLKRKHNSGGSLREAPVLPRVGKRAEYPSLFVKTDKKQKEIKIKCAQKHFKSALGQHTEYRKKRISKNCLKRNNLVLQKGTKESNISLGSWLDFWASCWNIINPLIK